MLVFIVLQMANAGQIPVPPIFTPCTFPTPTDNRHEYRLMCNTIPRLPFICDLHNQLPHANLIGIEAAYERYKAYFNQNNRSSLAVLIVRQLEAPASAAAVYKSASYSCLFESECNQMDTEVVHGFVNNIKIFIKTLEALSVHLQP
ncbi:hypothetical protein KIN20_036692 [Parelaphostrongylus tenuis]|uniref:Uncharacterized protein n=1 Tax=Parelaphostrongylus tenuis TaxID=148309 RepID=A0AAD5RCX1_PARTN|nr:hypothetical protein KIN20_036692 [Parelaphostrongylus tenuis]